MQRPANTALTSEESPATSDTTPEDGTGSAWQSATENAVLHAAVLRHMCQQSDDAETRAQLEAGTAMPSTVRQQPPEVRLHSLIVYSGTEVCYVPEGLDCFLHLAFTKVPHFLFVA